MIEPLKVQRMNGRVRAFVAGRGGRKLLPGGLGRFPTVEHEEALVAGLKLRGPMPHDVMTAGKPHDGAFRSMTALVHRVHVDHRVAPDWIVFAEALGRAGAPRQAPPRAPARPVE